MEPVVICLATLAVAADLKTDRIPNELTFSGICIGLLLAFLRAGPCGLLSATGSVLAMFVITFLIFLTNALKGGDGKLLCAVSAILGLNDGLKILFLAMIISVPLGLVIHLVKNRGKTISALKQSIKLHFSVPLLIASAWYLCLY